MTFPMSCRGPSVSPYSARTICGRQPHLRLYPLRQHSRKCKARRCFPGHPNRSLWGWHGPVCKSKIARMGRYLGFAPTGCERLNSQHETRQQVCRGRPHAWFQSWFGLYRWSQASQVIVVPLSTIRLRFHSQIAEGYTSKIQEIAAVGQLRDGHRILIYQLDRSACGTGRSH
jgi:hypothetical protein